MFPTAHYLRVLWALAVGDSLRSRFVARYHMSCGTKFGWFGGGRLVKRMQSGEYASTCDVSGVLDQGLCAPPPASTLY